MEKMNLLVVDCCVSQRGKDGSRTRRLLEAFLESFRRTHPDLRVTTAQLEKMALEPFDASRLDQRDALARAGRFDAPVFAAARQFQAADAVVVAAPFWDLSFPAMLRIYIEHISANGLTYHYDAQGCHGDCRASSLLYLTTGGDFEREESLGVLYWRQLCAMFGIDRYDYVFAGGLDAEPDRAEERLKAAMDLARKMGETL